MWSIQVKWVGEVWDENSYFFRSEWYSSKWKSLNSESSRCPASLMSYHTFKWDGNQGLLQSYINMHQVDSVLVQNLHRTPLLHLSILRNIITFIGSVVSKQYSPCHTLKIVNSMGKEKLVQLSLWWHTPRMVVLQVTYIDFLKYDIVFLPCENRHATSQTTFICQ